MRTVGLNPRCRVGPIADGHLSFSPRTTDLARWLTVRGLLTSDYVSSNESRCARSAWRSSLTARRICARCPPLYALRAAAAFPSALRGPLD